MPSVDVVSTVDLQTMDNAVNNTKREVTTRYDFKNSQTELSLDKKEKRIHMVTADDMKVNAIMDMLIGQCSRLKIDPKCLELGTIEETAHNAVKADVGIKQGISRDLAQQMVKLVKGTKLKVQAAIQEDQVRLTGKKIDDLQAIMQMLREEDYDVPLQFVNMKS